MKKLILFYSLILISISTIGAELTISGNYYNENIFIDNPSVGDGFCVSQVLVNGKNCNIDLQSNTFEIDLGLLQLKPVEAVKITIIHQESCTPIILNPNALIQKCFNQIISARYDKKNSEILWSGVKENCSIPYIIEQFKWERWIQLGQVESKLISDTNRYSFKVELHSDANLFRVKQITPRGDENISSDIKAKSLIKEVGIVLDKEGNNIIFSMETNYEIYNQKSELLKSGKATSVNIADMKKDTYIVCFDNAIVQVVKNK